MVLLVECQRPSSYHGFKLDSSARQLEVNLQDKQNKYANLQSSHMYHPTFCCVFFAYREYAC